MAISTWNGLEAPLVSFACAPLFVSSGFVAFTPLRNRQSDPRRHSRNTDGGEYNDEGNFDRHFGGGRTVCAHRHPDRIGLPLRRRRLRVRKRGKSDRLFAAGTYRPPRGGGVLSQDGRSRCPASVNRKSRPFRWAAFRFSKTPLARCVIIRNESKRNQEMGCSYQLSTDANPWHHQQGKENLDGGA